MKTFAIDRNTGSPRLAKILKGRIEKRIGKNAIEVVGMDGHIPEGVEWRIVQDRAGYLVNVVNYNSSVRTIRLKGNRNENLSSRDLISGENIGETHIIKPLVPMLIRVHP